MAKVAILYDAFRCTGCRGCQVACKQWNDLPAEVTRNTGSYQNPPRVSADTWLIMEFREVEDGDGPGRWAFRRYACMHCLHPACVSACPVGALYKTDEGPVLYHADRCIGCRYCMLACPFNVPTFQWGKGLFEGAEIKKCTFCIDRLSAGLEPACVHTCPAAALMFGDREELLAVAEARIREHPERYVNHVYGKDEAGGTSLLYIGPVRFEELGMPEVGSAPIQEDAEALMTKATPAVLVGMLVGLSGIYWVVKRRQEMMGKSKGSGR
ncbi:MAG: 4Fe-4S dicluster domain-containing protein [Dehalococcoidia bacterium]